MCLQHASDLWPKDLRQTASLPYNLSRGRTSTYSTAKTSTTKHQREVSTKHALHSHKCHRYSTNLFI